MPKVVQTPNDAENQYQFNELVDSLIGLPKFVAKKFLNAGFITEVKNCANNYGVKNASGLAKKLVEIASKKAINGIFRKIAIALIVIVSIFAIIGIVVTLLINKNILIPIVVLVILIVIIWLLTSFISRLISRKVSILLFNAIELLVIYNKKSEIAENN